MLETGEVDDDFFTPVAGTSLANIFGNVAHSKEITDNDSLKYIPPKPQNIVPIKKAQSKATECVFACALIGHEWCNNIYTSRGKLGFAIVKIQKTGDHNIVLYDSNKTTLSNTAVSSHLDITVKNSTYISYYDNLQKYWSIYGTQDEIKKIAEVLKSLGANVNYSAYEDKGPPEPFNSEIDITIAPDEKQNKESDTDSSMNRKTKASILNRMANMGHSVLPTRILPAEISSDSSDANEVEPQPKAVRHKTAKACLKRNNVENIMEPQHSTDINQRIIASKTEMEKNVTVYNSQLVPVTNTGVIASSSNDLSMFMSEQRISNSELRININRINDKVDMVLNKMNSVEPIEKKTSASTDIMLKLIAEYENKIKVYEEILKARGMDEKKITEDALGISNKDNETGLLKMEITKLEKGHKDKTMEVSNLQNQIKCLKDTHAQDVQSQLNKEKELLAKITNLENDLKVKDDQLTDFKTERSSNINDNDNIKDKVKNIMNDTFQTISNNFETHEAYSGETIRRIVGTVIKKITIQTLSEL